MRTLLAGSALLIALSAAAASAQVSSGRGGEVVITAEGQLNPPWIEKSVCEADGCRLIVFNPDTHEIARLNGRLTNYFMLSGAGWEVVRTPR
jgi:hypothetical protein